MIILEASNIGKKYGGSNGIPSVTAVDTISMKVKEGEFIAIMGTSGSGKTTLLKMLSGILRPDRGEVRLENTVISDMHPDRVAQYRRRKMGFVFQDFNLLDYLTVKENISIPLVLDHYSPEEIEQRVDEMIQIMDIGEFSSRYPVHISGGQKQRVAIARAFINEPRVLFADEPTGSLDSNTAKTVMTYLRKMCKEKNTTTVMVTHDPFAASFSDRIVFITHGLVGKHIHREQEVQKDYYYHIMETVISFVEDQ